MVADRSLILLVLSSVLLASTAAHAQAPSQKYRWDFRIGEAQIRNGPEMDGTSDSPGWGWGHFAYDEATETLDYTTPLRGYYQAGSGTHPGGGVTGASGRLAALKILKDAPR